MNIVELLLLVRSCFLISSHRIINADTINVDYKLYQNYIRRNSFFCKSQTKAKRKEGFWSLKSDKCRETVEQEGLMEPTPVLSPSFIFALLQSTVYFFPLQIDFLS